MQLDTAVLQLLGLDGEKTTLSPSGGGGCSAASTFKITGRKEDGDEVAFFLKTSSGEDAEVMFRGEDASLRAIHNVVPSLCPRSFGYGKFVSRPQTWFLVTEFLHLRPRSRSAATSPSAPPSLAAKLAKLHSTPAPVPDGYEKPVFGFPVVTCCGDTAQENGFEASWAEFYAEKRLRFILGRAERTQGLDGDLRGWVERTAGEVVPRLLGDGHVNEGRGIVPVVVHGDLWSGNAGVGVVGVTSEGREAEDVVFDPAACYAHGEFEAGIMQMFGGFGKEFWDEYFGLCPVMEPVGEYRDRVKLYELYHHLNHYAMFGGGYRGGAVRIMEELVGKYGR